MSEFKDWVMNEQEKDDILDQISDELEQMSINKFSDLVDQYDLILRHRS